ncbi:MAG: response regulator transcription factor [Eubacteriales bacterium]|nr:response regulator transcription factor [Clostridiales bacterium]MDD6933430.1 response regulator transcription factor [Eubacteriales bacterium]MDY2600209.1 response regulator transcription factor [Eubacteriales bacterium]
MKVLIVEDERALADALEHIVRRAGYAADAVYNGTDALAQAMEGGYDVIVLDVMLPDMDGFQIVSRLRARGNPTPVLMLTARADVSDKVTGLNAGADDYMTKPFDNAELLARLNALCRRTGEVVLNEIHFADVTLDLNAARLSAGSDSVQLSKKEFELARLLLSHPRQTLSMDAIYSHVWGLDAEVTENNVMAYVSFLRKKLKYLNSRVTIRNIPQIGYRLEEAGV